jgi:hypothetical protein
MVRGSHEHDPDVLWALINTLKERIMRKREENFLVALEAFSKERDERSLKKEKETLKI